MMDATLRWTSADLELMPDDGKRYEIIDGELYVSKQPHWHHQLACSRLLHLLTEWSTQTRAGVANGAPGLIFAEDDDVAPDVVWISNARLAVALGDDGKLRAVPELVVEVLSPGTANEERDRVTKRQHYGHWGVQEYWIIDRFARTIEIYRLAEGGLQPVVTLGTSDDLSSPLLPGFSHRVGNLFANLPA